MPWFFEGVALVIGAIIGSFLNVVIHRYPRGESVVFPPSRCPRCKHHIAWYDNIPVLSYAVLAGKCRQCRGPIDLRYPLVEAANALFYLAIYLRAGLSVGAGIVAAIVSITITLIYIDADIQILPDVIDIPGIILGLLLAVSGLAAGSSDLLLALDWVDSLIGAAAGAAVILAVAAIYYAIRRIEGMGMGDAKMLAMIGAVIGWRPLYATMLTACVAGALTGGVMAVKSRRRDLRFALPFGTFLGLAFLVMLFFGERYVYSWIPVLRFGR